MNKQCKNIVFLFLCILIVISCNTKKYLGSGETYLEKSEIVYEEALSNKNSALVKDQLPQLILLQPNSGFLWIPRRWFYFKDKELQKDNWYWNFINNNLSERPAIVEKSILERTTRSMQEYLYTKGYLDATVDYSVDTGKYNSTVTYHIYPEELHTIDSLVLASSDTALLKVIKKHRQQKYLHKGAPIDKGLYQQEVGSIVQIARNNGYPQFFSNYVDLLAVDTTNDRNLVQITILTPSNEDHHIRYRVGEVSIHPALTIENTQDTLIDQIIWKIPLDSYTVKVNYLQEKIKLEPGSIYSKRDYDNTLQNINAFDIYRFPTSRTNYDTINQLVNYSIFLHKDSLYALSRALEVFYSDISNVNNQLIGLSGSVQFSNRNLFGGGEVFSANTEGSFELGLNNLSNASANSYNFSLGFGLRLPRFAKYPILYDIADLIAPDAAFISKFKNYAQTSHTIEYQFTRRESFYTYNSINARSGYLYRPDENTSIELNHFGINFWSPDIEPRFDAIIGDNILFRRRFSQRFITGLLLKDISYEKKKPPNAFNESYRFFSNFETSGLEVMAIERVAKLANAKVPFSIPTGEEEFITFSKYIRSEVEGSYHRVLNDNESIAARATAGIGLGLDPEGLPYIKQFNVGGPYSIRAWPLRALGPGSFHVDQSFRENRLPFYQTGDFKFEANFEYRFHITWILEGAFFVDIGNVWNLDDDNPDYNLQWDSYKQLAIGSGTGLRFKFPFEVTARLDLGYPIRYPYEIRGGRWIFDQDFESTNESIWQPLTFNFAIGYPF